MFRAGGKLHRVTDGEIESSRRRGDEDALLNVCGNNAAANTVAAWKAVMPLPRPASSCYNAE